MLVSKSGYTILHDLILLKYYYLKIITIKIIKIEQLLYFKVSNLNKINWKKFYGLSIKIKVINEYESL